MINRKIKKNMTTKELIKILEKINPALEVYLSTDAEGNGFGTVDKTSFCITENGGGLIIYPFEEGLNEDELK